MGDFKLALVLEFRANMPFWHFCGTFWHFCVNLGHQKVPKIEFDLTNELLWSW